MEIRHKQSVISFLLIAVGFCRAFADLHLWNKEREHSSLSSIFTKKEARSDYKIIHKF